MASNGKWYAPTAQPGTPTGQPASGPHTPGGPKEPKNIWQKFRGLPLAAQIASWVVLAFVLIGVISAATGSNKKPTHTNTGTVPAVASSTTKATSKAPATTTVHTTSPPPTVAPTTAATTPPTVPPTTAAP